MFMKKYKVYFKIFDKKLVTTVKASSFFEAKQKVKDNLIFLKIVPEDDPFDFLKKMFGM